MNKIVSLILTRWSEILLVLMVVGYSVMLSYLSILRHEAFYSNYDLANMDQTVWNTSQGRILELSGKGGTVSRFSIHADAFLAVISPVYWIWSDVRALLIIQTVALGSGAIWVYLITKKVLESKILALNVSLMYLLNPGMQWTNLYDFHSVAVAIPFLLGTVYMFLNGKWKWYWTLAVLAMITKEQVSLWIAMLGIWALMRRQWKVGIWSVVIGLMWFVVCVFVIMPYMTTGGEKHWAWSWYGVSEQSASVGANDIRGIFKNFGMSFIGKLVNYLKMLMENYGYLPLLGLPWVMLASGDLVINVLSGQGQMVGLNQHYDSAIIPALILGVVYGVKLMRIIMEKYWVKEKIAIQGMVIGGLMAWGLIMSLRGNYFLGPLPFTPACWCWMYQVSDQDREFEEMLRQIPKEASVTASGNVRPHLSHRKDAYTLPGMVEQVDYVAISTQERIVGGVRDLDFEKDLVLKLLGDERFENVYNSDPFYIFKRK